MQLLERLLIGSEQPQRLRVQRTLTAAAIYGFCFLLLANAVHNGWADATQAAWYGTLLSVGVGAFYVAIRSGFSCRFEDPALTMPQIVFAMLALAGGYRINGPGREMLMLVAALVLVFGAFTLPPRRCRQTGWIAVVLLGGAMMWGSLQHPDRFAPGTEIVHFLFVAVILPTIAALAGQLSGLRLSQQRQKHELKDAVQRLHEMATHDELTRLVNRHHVQDWISHELARVHRHGASLCLALIDLDHFKRINDTLGHAWGDEVLRIFAREARTMLRAGDVLARWGGEEFLLVMPDTTIDEALRVLGRLRARLAPAAVWSDCPQARVTFSAGVTLLGPGQTLDSAVQRADLKLYEAKERGRDTFVADDVADDIADGVADSLPDGAGDVDRGGCPPAEHPAKRAA